VFEESGFEARATRLLAVYDKRVHPHPPQPFYIYKLIFACDIVGGAAQTSDETDDVDFFSPDALSELSLDRILPSQIVRLFALTVNPLVPAEFD
jgi:ADP-ribose pyrophosphatase YjhB (NUDIX family)